MDELFTAVLIAGAFFVFALLIQISGTLFADWRNHKRRMNYLEKEHENSINYMKKEISFKKKLNFFEELSVQLDKEYEFYLETIEDIKEGKKLDLKKMQGNSLFKQNLEIRKKFYEIDIYMDSYKILSFWDNCTDIESEIDKEIDKNQEKRNLKKLENLLDKLLSARTILIHKIREELEIN